MPTIPSRTPMLSVAIGFALIVGLLGAVLYNDFSHLAEMERDMRRVGVEVQRKSRLAQQLRNTIRDRMVTVSTMLMDEDPFGRDELMLRFHALGNRFIVTRAELESSASDAAEKRLLRELRELTIWATPFQERVVSLAHDDRLEEGRLFLRQSALPAQNRVLAQCDRLLDFYAEHAEHYVEARVAHYAGSHRRVLVFALPAVVISVLFALYAVTRMARDRRRLLDEVARCERRGKGGPEPK